MTRRPRSVRCQRLGLMALVVGLAVAGLVTHPTPPEEAPRFRVKPVPAPRPAPRLARLPGPTAAPVTPPADVAPVPTAGDATADATDATTDAHDVHDVEREPLAPDIVVALERPEAEALPPFLRVSHVHATDSAQWVPGPALPLVDSVMGSGDGIEGFEPGMLYWFGPQGLQKVQVSMEAQR
jgi:hypothetical protein